MDGLNNSLLKKIDEFIKMEIGDATRLKHIRQSIIENRRLYNSDIQYVNGLEKKNPLTIDENKEKYQKDTEIICWKCQQELKSSPRFCPFCGADQEQTGSEFTEVLSRRRKIEYNPIKIIPNLHSYQILSVIGGICALIPIIIAASNLERIFEIIEFYTNRDFSGLFVGFTVLGAISGLLSCLVMVIPFVIKKPKRVGKFLFFSSFGILVFSLATGVVGFGIILFAGILALKKRRY